MSVVPSDESRTSSRTVALPICVLCLVAFHFISSVVAAGTDKVSANVFPKTHFVRALSHRKQSVRVAAIQRMERQFAGNRDAYLVLRDAIDRTGGDPASVSSRTRLIRALRTMEHPQLVEFLTQLLAAKDYRVSMSALDVLVAKNESRSLPSILALAERDDYAKWYAYRMAVLRAAMSFQEPMSIEFLISQLPKLGGHSESVVRRFLAEMSGLANQSDVDTFRQWWNEADQERFSFNEYKTPDDGGAGSSGAYQKPKFFGIDVDAGRVVFVFDKSQSMGLPLSAARPDRRGAETRMSRAKRELAGVVGSLPKETYFGIVVFDGRVATWRPNLVQATDANKARAFTFIAAIPPGGETAWFDAIDAALRMDGNTEVIFFLTDGVPTVGRIVALNKIVKAVTDENRYRRVTLHTVGLGVHGRAARFLETLADENDGEYRVFAEGAESGQKGPTHEPHQFAPRVMFSPARPPIHRVKTFSAARGNRRLQRDELVLGVVVGDVARAYPLNMLTGPDREIINDVLDGTPIAVTWCHLCHYGVVYHRQVGDKTLVFSVSGLLWTDNLVMVDNNTHSQWSQIYGKAMRGPLAGVELERMPATITEWAQWRDAHPETRVMLLSRTAEDYDRSIYGRLKDYVLGAVDGGVARSWPFNVLVNRRVVNDQLNGRPVLVTFDVDSNTAFLYARDVDDTTYSFRLRDGLVTDIQTGSTWDLRTGRATDGPLADRQLPLIASTVSFRSTWSLYYPTGSVMGDE